jgi:hypothetical protein
MRKSGDINSQKVIKVFSFGGGVQSMACLVLAAQGKIDYQTFLFSNVGDDSEYPETMVYLREVAMPYAKENNLNLIELHKTRRDGTTETLWQKLHRTERSIDIPMRLQSGAPGNRSCTADFKIKVVSKWMRQAGATKNNRGVVGIGISTDEITRLKPSQLPHIVNAHPLIDLGLSRNDCKKLISDAGLPVPPKSSCFFCPFHSIKEWRRMYDEQPELFARSVALEKMINERRLTLGRDPMYLTGALRPLDEVVNGSHQWQLSFLEKAQDGQYSCGPFTCDGGSGGDDSSDGLVIKVFRGDKK